MSAEPEEAPLRLLSAAVLLALAAEIALLVLLGWAAS
jgi:hypothetical protein